jgi:hypothetical protein
MSPVRERKSQVMADSDRRRQPRHLLRIEGRLIAPGSHNPLVVVDISEGGVGLQAQRCLVPETRVALEIGESENKRFTFRGKVVWCAEQQAGGLPIYRMGIFIDMIVSWDQTAVLPIEKSAMLGRIVTLFAPRQTR